MSRDLLLLLESGFTDPDYPGERFICPGCVPIEGLLVGDPDKLVALDIHRLPFAKPRQVVVEVLDVEHQSLPVLLLGDEHAVPVNHQYVKKLGDKYFVNRG